jgi:HEAT repeat protein
MTTQAPQTSKAPRTWLPMILWSTCILLALGLTWLIAALVVPYWRLRAELKDYLSADTNIRGERIIDSLGGPKAALPKLRFYLRLPRRLMGEDDRYKLVYLMQHCGRDALPALIAALHDDGLNMRWYACEVLGAMGAEARPAVPHIITALADKDVGSRAGAAWALGEIEPVSREAIPALIKATADTDWNVRRLAVRTLGRIGPDAKCAEEAISKALAEANDPAKATIGESDMVRANATWALDAILRGADRSSEP